MEKYRITARAAFSTSTVPKLTLGSGKRKPIIDTKYIPH